jgi:ABC-type branched-subunit amino acid transport system substrate-binding protein
MGMKRISRLFFVLFVLSMSACIGQRTITRSIPRDLRAVELVNSGKRYLKVGDFSEAARLFDEAVSREFNQLSTAAIYLSGISHFKNGNTGQATQRFNTILELYPKSRYAEDARYHKALLLVQSSNKLKQGEGLAALISLTDDVTDPDISREAFTAAREYLFYKLDPFVVEDFYAKVPAQHKLTVLEALCFQKVNLGEVDSARKMYRTFAETNGESSEFLDKLLKEQTLQQQFAEKEYAKIAVFLPLFLEGQSYDSIRSISDRSKISLEFYEGLQQALDEYSESAGKKIYLKLFDSRRSNAVVSSQLDELVNLYPDLIIGDIFNTQSRVISDWAEERGVPQLVPLSPSPSLIEGRTQVFLANPSVQTHGAQMAIYAKDSLHLSKIAVWTDGTRLHDQIAGAFQAKFDSLGGETMMVLTDSIYQRAMGSIPSAVRGLSAAGVDGVYIPFNSEETVGLILSQLNAYNIDAEVMMPPFIERFQIIDRELKEKYEVLFTSSYFVDQNAEDYLRFFNDYAVEYQMAPSDFSLQGYDIGKYVFSLLNAYDYSGNGVSAFIHSRPKTDGVHLDFFFGEYQDNQSVNICKYTRSGIVKVND